MKTILTVVVLLTVVVASPVFALTCGKGCYVYRGICACDEPSAEKGPTAVQPSDEKLPEGRMPSWQRAGISVINAPNMALEDEKHDQERVEADQQGKHKAGIK